MFFSTQKTAKLSGLFIYFFNFILIYLLHLILPPWKHSLVCFINWIYLNGKRTAFRCKEHILLNILAELYFIHKKRKVYRLLFFFSSFSFLRLENFFYDVLHKRLTETYVLLSFWELNIPWCLVRRITGSPRGKVRLVPLYRPQKSKSFKESVVTNL